MGKEIAKICKPMVSVVVPIYNTEKYITECIESLLQQTYKSLEIVLVDDGSTDSSGHICDLFAAQSPSIKVIHTNNQGRTQARFTGVERATGEYVSFVDADDYVVPEYIEILLKCLLEYEVDISCCQNYNTYGNHKSQVEVGGHGRFDKKRIIKILSSKYLYDEKFGYRYFSHYLCCKMYKKNAILKVLPIAKHLWSGEDVVTTFALLKMSDSIYVSKEFLYYYRQHEGQTVKKFDMGRWYANIETFKKLDDLDNDNYLENQLPVFILALLRDWLIARFQLSNSFGEFKSDMEYALKNETMEKLFMQKHIATSNKRHRILAFLAQHKMYLLYYIFLKAHLSTLRFRG